MSKKKKPLLSDEFLNELANEINQLFGDPDGQNDEQKEDKQIDEIDK
jgi:hypothetical protein